MTREPVQQTFIAESRDLLRSMEQALLHLETAPGDSEAVNRVFRAAHTIKGSAGVVGFDGIVDFAHKVESLLDKLRSGEIPIDEELIGLLLACGDHIGVPVDQAAGLDVDPARASVGTALLERVNGRLGAFETETDDAAHDLPIAPEANTPLTMKRGDEHGSVARSDAWHISLRFGREVLRNGMDPLSFIRYLGNLGEIVGMVTLPDAIPVAEEMDPESCYLGVEIDLRSAADKKTIEDVFQFMRDDCVLRILPPHSRLVDYVDHIDALPEDEERLGDLLVESGALTRRELDEMLALQRDTGASARSAVGAGKTLGGMLVEQGLVQTELVDAALAKQKHIKEHRAREGNLIRVRADKLDKLINLVGELVIAGAGASLLAQRSDDAALKEAMSSVTSLMDDIRGSALQLRMVQIGETFTRFKRVVHDLSGELDKAIDLVITGADTELDKTVTERIADPLTHLVRNAIDHGIEPVEQRRALGKPDKGTVRLNAYHDSGSIVIEVSDDGAGLNREKILARALAQGIVSADQPLSEREIDQLVFEAGFSTAEKVTNLSGRGVGMDVVRRSVEALRGTTEIESRPGAGTTVRMRVPLTLAIIEGFLMGVGKTSFVVPLDAVVECIELKEANTVRGRDYVNLRGQVLPYVRLRELFNETGNVGRRESVVVVQYAGRKAGLLVDRLVGELQTVIRPLGSMFSRLRGLSGTTILGSGEVALILDVPALVQLAISREAHAA